MKFFIKDLFSKCNQIRTSPRIWSNILKKSLMKNFIFFAVIKLKFPRVGLDEKGGVFIINFEHISHLVLVFLLLTLNM